MIVQTNTNTQSIDAAKKRLDAALTCLMREEVTQAEYQVSEAVKMLVPNYSMMIPAEGYSNELDTKIKNFKFDVFKTEDVEKYLTTSEITFLDIIKEKISKGRVEDNRNIYNNYLVVNTDEPYASQVVAILQANGHWG